MILEAQKATAAGVVRHGADKLLLLTVNDTVEAFVLSEEAEDELRVALAKPAPAEESGQ